MPEQFDCCILWKHQLSKLTIMPWQHGKPCTSIKHVLLICMTCIRSMTPVLSRPRRNAGGAANRRSGSQTPPGMYAGAQRPARIGAGQAAFCKQTLVACLGSHAERMKHLTNECHCFLSGDICPCQVHGNYDFNTHGHVSSSNACVSLFPIAV